MYLLDVLLGEGEDEVADAGDGDERTGAGSPELRVQAGTEQGTINTRLRLEETMNTNRDRERRRQGAGADRIWHAHAYLS